MKGKVRREKEEDFFPFGKHQKREEQKKAAEIKIEESIEVILSHCFIFFLRFQCEYRRKIRSESWFMFVTSLRY